jgi:hypothetical protein
MNKASNYIGNALVLGLILIPVAVPFVQDNYKSFSNEHIAKQSPAPRWAEVSVPKASKLASNLDVPLDGNDLGPGDLPKDKQQPASSKPSTDTFTDLTPDSGAPILADPALHADEVLIPRGAKSTSSDHRVKAKIISCKEVRSSAEQPKWFIEAQEMPAKGSSVAPSKHV